jgi:hypothetical protein
VGKGYPLRAIMNSVWLDKLTPIIGSLPICWVMIAHEKVKIDADQWDLDYNVKGGKSLYYDSSLVVRVDVQRSLKMAMKVGDKEKKIEIGRLHNCVVEKSKVGICHEKFNFVVSNGKGGMPIGFDIVLELLEEAKLRGDMSALVRKSGAVWKHEAFPDGRIKGDGNVASFLRENIDVLETVIRDMNRTAIDAIVSVDEVDDED